MQTAKHFIQAGIVLVFLVFVVGCHGNRRFTQTFVNEEQPERSLTLESQVGLIRPAANFPHNVLFRLFGTQEMSGTYVLTTTQGQVRGTFTGGTDGQTQWIKFISEDKTEWQVKALGGSLVETDNSVWLLKQTNVDGEVAQSLKIIGR